MEGKRHHLALLALIFLVTAALACNDGTQEVDTDDLAATAVAQTLQAVLRATALSLTPSPTVQPPPTDVPTVDQPTDAPPTPQATLPPKNTPTEEPAADLKEAVYFGGGAGGVCGASCPPPTTDPPTVTWEQDSWGQCAVLCLHGFLPLEEQFVVALYESSGTSLSQGVFRIEREGDNFELVQLSPPKYLGPHEWAGYVLVEEKTPITVIKVWVPMGLPWGQWRAEARSERGTVEGWFLVPEPDLPTISTMPSMSIDPFEDHRGDTYGPNSEVVVRGGGFEPNAALPLGIYYLTGEIVPSGELQGMEAGVLTNSRVVKADGHGSFAAVMDVGSTEPGMYCAVAVAGTGREAYSLTGSHREISCFYVEE